MKNEATPKGDNIQIGKTDVTSIQPPIKKELFIETLLRSGNRGITQPEAYLTYHESCLHTSVSTLQNLNGIAVLRRSDKSTIVHRRQRAFNRYWLADHNQAEKALRLLNHYRKQRNAPPLSLNDIYPVNGKAA